MFLGFSKWTSLGRSHVLLWIYHKIFLLIDWLLITCDLQSWNFRNILNDVFYLHLWPQLSPSGPWPVVVVTNLFDFLPCVASQNTRFQAMETQWLLSLFWITCRCSFLLPKIAFCFARRATVTSTMNAMSGVCGSSSSVECVFLNQIRNLLALSANHQLGAYSLVIAQAFACVCMPLGCVVVSWWWYFLEENTHPTLIKRSNFVRYGYVSDNAVI